MAELSNVDIVVYALYLLGGTAKAVDTEEVAVRSWELFPERFSWMKFPQYPDKNAAQKRLYDARKERNGTLVRGKDKGGWRLTAAGVERARVVGELLQDANVDAKLRESNHQEERRFLNELERHPALQTYKRAGGCDDVKWYEFTDFLRCLVDTPPRKLMEKLENYRSRAHEAGRKEILNFLAACEKRFNDRLGN